MYPPRRYLCICLVLLGKEISQKQLKASLHSIQLPPSTEVN